MTAETIPGEGQPVMWRRRGKHKWFYRESPPTSQSGSGWLPLYDRSTRPAEPAYYAAIAECLERYRPMAEAAERRDLVEFIDQLSDEIGTRAPLYKLNRWLGYIQGVLIETGCTDVLTERNWSRPHFRPLDFSERDQPDATYYTEGKSAGSKPGRYSDAEAVARIFERHNDTIEGLEADKADLQSRYDVQLALSRINNARAEAAEGTLEAERARADESRRLLAASRRCVDDLTARLDAAEHAMRSGDEAARVAVEDERDRLLSEAIFPREFGPGAVSEEVWTWLKKFAGAMSPEARARLRADQPAGEGDAA